MSCQALSPVSSQAGSVGLAIVVLFDIMCKGKERRKVRNRTYLNVPYQLIVEL